MRLTRNARNSIPGTAWYTCQQPGPWGGEGSPPRHAPQGKPLKTRWPFGGQPLTKERRQNLGYGCRGGGRPLPQHTRTQYSHNQKWPRLGQLAAQEIWSPPQRGAQDTTHQSGGRAAWPETGPSRLQPWAMSFGSIATVSLGQNPQRQALLLLVRRGGLHR